MGYVYLLSEWSKDELNYKIGITRGSVEKRIKSLQTGNPNEIVLVHKYQTKNYLKVEKWMHRKYAEYRLEGEWFNLTDELVSEFLMETEKADANISFLKENNPFFN